MSIKMQLQWNQHITEIHKKGFRNHATNNRLFAVNRIKKVHWAMFVCLWVFGVAGLKLESKGER